jgi:hypothetical protein
MIRIEGGIKIDRPVDEEQATWASLKQFLEGQRDRVPHGH